MTITYTQAVSTGRFFSFAGLLFRWHGSLWKAVYKELTVWLLVYGLLSVLYRNVLGEQHRIFFENLVIFCYKHADFIPLNFILGFFVTLVVQRWWEMFNNFGWIDNTALYVATYVDGRDDRARIIRRNIVRYVALSQALVFRDISPIVGQRFPDDEAFQVAGFLTENERHAMQAVVSPHGKYWLPIHWAFDLIKQARISGNIASDRAVELCLERIREFRTGISRLRAFHWVPVPLVYSQVVFLAVRSYLALAVVGRQYIVGNRQDQVDQQIDVYFPLMSMLQFVFYLGWMKVAEALLNPFGNDDDDFECNWFIDRNLQVGFSIVDAALGGEPPMERDLFWEELNPIPLYGYGTVNAPVYHQNIALPEKTARYVHRALHGRLQQIRAARKNQRNGSESS